MTPIAQPTEIDPNNAFTRDLLRNLVGTVRGQPDETEAEYDERFAAVTAAWAAFRPRDTLEQMLAAHIVGAHHAGLDCLSRAMAVEDSALADRLRRSHATMVRTMRDTMRLLDRQQQQPADTAPPVLALAPIPPPRPRPPEPNAEQNLMQRENPAEMPAAEPDPAMAEKQALAVAAMFDNKHPLHREALHLLREILPDIVIPESWFDEPPAMAA